MWQPRHCPQHIVRRIVSTGVMFLILGCMLVACGSSMTTGGQKTPTPQPISCGSATGGHSGVVSSTKSSTQKAVTCFYHAYQQCQPATLTFTTFAVDTGAVNHLSVKDGNSSCAIQDSVQHYIAPNPPGTATMYTCSTMIMQADGLHIQQCGTLGTVLIPLT